MASVGMGRRHLPPDEISWLATSGIIATCDPVRDKIVVLTRAMSSATSSISRSMDDGERLSKGTMTAKRRAPNERTCEHRNAMAMQQVQRAGQRFENAKPAERTTWAQDQLDKRK